MTTDNMFDCRNSDLSKMIIDVLKLVKDFVTGNQKEY